MVTAWTSRGWQRRTRVWVAAAGLMVIVLAIWAPHPARADPILMLSVQGNTLVDGSGAVVQLRGVDGHSAASPCVNNYGPIDGPQALNSTASVPDPAAATVATDFLNWSINTVRIQLNEDCWLGINGVPAAYGGVNYQQVIANYVTTLTSHRIYVILDLHWTAPAGILSTMQDQFPDADHAPLFWSQVASRFASNRAVIMDLFNEPKPWVSPVYNWRCWRDG